jgi:hypothetical protein
MPALIQNEVQIEDLRNQPADIETLRNLLEAGAPLHPDPKRDGFYEVESTSLVFYIHVSPIMGKVLLLAAWSKDRDQESGEDRAA